MNGSSHIINDQGYFNKISNDLDSALNKNASASKSRPAEVEDGSNLLTATKSCFRYGTLGQAQNMPG